MMRTYKKDFLVGTLRLCWSLSSLNTTQLFVCSLEGDSEGDTVFIFRGRTYFSVLSSIPYSTFERVVYTHLPGGAGDTLRMFYNSFACRLCWLYFPVSERTSTLHWAAHRWTQGPLPSHSVTDPFAVEYDTCWMSSSALYFYSFHPQSSSFSLPLSLSAPSSPLSIC